MTRPEHEHVAVAIIGSGPAGIGVATGLAARGVGPIVLLERWDRAGGVPAKYPHEPGGSEPQSRDSRRSAAHRVGGDPRAAPHQVETLGPTSTRRWTAPRRAEAGITVPTHANKPVGEFLSYKLKFIEPSHYRDHKRYYSKKELIRDMEEVGFVNVSAHYWELGMNLYAEGYKP